MKGPPPAEQKVRAWLYNAEVEWRFHYYRMLRRQTLCRLGWHQDNETVNFHLDGRITRGKGCWHCLRDKEDASG